LGHILNRLELPVFYLKNKQATAWMKHDKVWMKLIRSDWYIIPAETIVF